MSNYGPYNYTQTSRNEATVPASTPGGRVVFVNNNTNNPLTLTGSFANNSGFIVLQPGSLALTFNGYSGSFTSGQFHEMGGSHVIYPIQLTYVSASNTGSVLVLYTQ
jgi:hypothetical protein